MPSPPVELGIDSGRILLDVGLMAENEPAGAGINLTVHKEVGSVRLDHKSFLIFETAS
jgi:hypothetical protein